MKARIFTYVECPCGHRGAIIESLYVGDFQSPRYRTWLRSLNHAGAYEGGDGLFAEAKPACPACGRSLSPENVVGRRALEGAGEVLRPKGESDGLASETCASTRYPRYETSSGDDIRAASAVPASAPGNRSTAVPRRTSPRESADRP